MMIMGTGVGQAQLQPTTGMWTLPPTRVRGGTFDKCQQTGSRKPQLDLTGRQLQVHCLQVLANLSCQPKD